MPKKITGLFCLAFLFLVFAFTGCYSVFSGGASGRIVDAESTGATKSGIADVDVYAYTSASDCDKDFNNWKGSDRFVPSAEYFSHTISGNDGRFVLSKIIWKSNKSKFGKDADYSKIYLLFYHENYGLVKGNTLIVSDSTSDTVYQEMTKIRKTTALQISLNDAATGNLTGNNVTVEVEVPQTTERLTDIPAKIYKATLSGSGVINISYPRWQNDENRTSGKETEPVVKISYKMSSDEPTWKACFNEDNAEKNFAFFDSEINKVSKKVSGTSYSVNLYGKSTRLYVPSVSGTCGDTSDPASDGVVISMKASVNGSAEWNIDCGETTTYAVTVGTSEKQIHGNFANLGAGIFWTDETYTGKYVDVKLQLSANGTVKDTITVRSGNAPYNVKI